MTITYVRVFHGTTRHSRVWPAGPWDDEPDKAEWRDEATGLPCMIKRNHLGALCGYVGAPRAHALYGIHYSDAEDVLEYAGHCGLTYSATCDERGEECPEDTICHLPLEGEDDDVWWLGFDCAHAWDVVPGMHEFIGFMPDAAYRDWEYVTQCVTQLAAAVSTANTPDVFEGMKDRRELL